MDSPGPIHDAFDLIMDLMVRINKSTEPLEQEEHDRCMKTGRGLLTLLARERAGQL